MPNFWPVAAFLFDHMHRGTRKVFFELVRPWFGDVAKIALQSPCDGTITLDLDATAGGVSWPRVFIDGLENGKKVRHMLQPALISSLPEGIKTGAKVSAGEFLGYARTDVWPFFSMDAGGFRGVLWSVEVNEKKVDPIAWGQENSYEFPPYQKEGTQGDDTLARLAVVIGGSYWIYSGKFLDGKEHPIASAVFAASSGYLLFKKDIMPVSTVDSLGETRGGKAGARLSPEQYHERFGQYMGWSADELPYSKTQPLASRLEMLRIERESGIPAPWIASMLQNESGARPDNHNRDENGNIEAAGMFQYTTSRLKEFGLTKQDVANMSLREQVDLYILDHTKPRKGGSYAEKMLHGADVYLALAAPSAMGSSDNTIVYDLEGTAKQQTGYRGMPGFDTKTGNNDGKITVAEMRQKLFPLYKEGLKHAKKAR